MVRTNPIPEGLGDRPFSEQAASRAADLTVGVEETWALVRKTRLLKDRVQSIVGAAVDLRSA